MKLFQSLYSKVLGWSQHRHAPVYLAAMSFAESSFFPVPVAVMLLPMCLAKPERAYRLAALTLFFSVLGGVAGYLLGWGAYGLIEPFTQIYTAQLERAKDWFTDYGVWVVLMAGFSPVPYKIFTISAGLLAMPFVSFIIASIFGRASQFYLIAFLTNKYGPSMEPKIRQYIEWIGWAVVALAIAGILWLNLKG